VKGTAVRVIIDLDDREAQSVLGLTNYCSEWRWFRYLILLSCGSALIGSIAYIVYAQFYPTTPRHLSDAWTVMPFGVIFFIFFFKFWNGPAWFRVVARLSAIIPSEIVSDYLLKKHGLKSGDFTIIKAVSRRGMVEVSVDHQNNAELPTFFEVSMESATVIRAI
jgi:hypothetical protein